VLFSPKEGDSAITQGFIREEFRDELTNLVSPKGINDIALILADAVENSQRQWLIDWFLSNNCC